MKSPFGIGYGLTRAASGALAGLRDADQEHRARELQDRAYGLQQAQDAREQGQYDMRAEDWRRLRMQQDADLWAQTLDPSRPAPSVTNLVPDAALPPGHPDGSATTPGLAPSRKGESRVDVAARTGKANALVDHDTLLQAANAAMANANAYNAVIHEEMGGQDPSTPEGQTAKAALERRFGSLRDAAYQQAMQLRQKAEEAKVQDYGRRAARHLLAGNVAAAGPYLESLGADPAYFQGLRIQDGWYVLPSGAKFTARTLANLANPETSWEQFQDALKETTDAVMKEMEARSRVQQASVSAAGDHYDPVLARAEEIARLDRLYASLPANDPQRSVIAHKVHNLRAMTGIAGAEARTKGAVTGEWKAGSTADLTAQRNRIASAQAILKDPLATPEQKAEAYAILADAPGESTPQGLVPPGEPAVNPNAAALY